MQSGPVFGPHAMLERRSPSEFRRLEWRWRWTNPSRCRRQRRPSWRWAVCRECWVGTSCQKDKSTTSVDTWVWSVLSVMCIELARLVWRTVVVRVTDRWHGAVVQTVLMKPNSEAACHLVDHLVSSFALPNPSCKTFDHEILYCCACHSAFVLYAN